MKKFFLFFGFLFFTLTSFAQDSLITSDLDYRGQAFLKGLHIDVGTAYISENSNLAMPDLFNVRTGRPSTFNIYFVRKLNLFKFFSFVPGIGLGLDNYFFEKDLLINPMGDSLFYIDESDTRDYKKSKLSANYVDIPLEFQFSTSPNYKKAFKIAVGGKVGVLFSGKSKIKYETDGAEVKTKYSDVSLNRFRYGLTGRIGYGTINVFAYYGLSPLFDTDYAPEVNPIIFGLSITSF